MSPGTRALGRGGITVPVAGFGAAALGNLYRPLPDPGWEDIAPAAWDAGVRYFDVAPHYGLGLAEERLGAFLRDRPREEFVLSTKVGRLLVDDPDGAGRLDDEGFAVPATRRRVRDYSRDGVLRSIEASLRRLGVDRIDLVFVHDPDEFEADALDGAFPALEELRAQGVIRSYGAGMNQSGMLARFAERTDLDVVLLAGRYTLLDQTALEDLLPVAARRRVDVVAGGVFNSGILAQDVPEADTHFDYAPAPAELVAKARAIAAIARQHGATLPRLAAQFPLGHPAVPVILLGGASPEQAARNAALCDEPVPAEAWSALVDAELLPAGVPVPGAGWGGGGTDG